MGHAALALVALTACTHAPKMLLGERVPDGCWRSDVTGDEPCIGFYLDLVKMAESLEYDDRELERYVASVGARLLATTGDHRRWTFRVLDDSDAEAEANIGTTVYITRGALVRLRSEAELAAILGHEIGHVLAGHSREAIAEAARGIARYTDEEAAGIRYGRDDEIQADALAVVLTARAGYDPGAVEIAFRAIAAGDADGDDPTDRHPRWLERIARVQVLAARYHGGELAEATYRVHVANLATGEDPRTVTVVGSALIFPRAGLAIDAPGAEHLVAGDAMAVVTFPGDVVVLVRVVAPSFVASLHASASRDVETVSYVHATHAVLLTSKGVGAAATLQRLHATFRAPRADELAQIHPQLIDFAAPRVLWGR